MYTIKSIRLLLKHAQSTNNGNSKIFITYEIGFYDISYIDIVKFFTIHGLLLWLISIFDLTRNMNGVPS